MLKGTLRASVKEKGNNVEVQINAYQNEKTAYILNFYIKIWVNRIIHIIEWKTENWGHFKHEITADLLLLLLHFS